MSEIVRLTGIPKYFGGVRALQGVDFDLRAGEVHALVGENGAGKSTLMRVLGGEHQPTQGTVQIDGVQITFGGPHEAIDKGITVIHQEMALAGYLTVAENIFLGELPRFINWPDLRRRAQGLIQSLGFDISPDALAGSLSVAHHELFGLCDRVLVMREGELTSELAPEAYSEENLLRLAMPGASDAA